MKIEKILKASQEFKDKYYNVGHFYEDDEYIKEMKITEEERKRILDEHNKMREIFKIDELYIALIAENNLELGYTKGDRIIFSNSENYGKSCLVICKYKNELLLARYEEDNHDEKIFHIIPLADEHTVITQKDKKDLKIYGSVLIQLRNVKNRVKQLRKG